MCKNVKKVVKKQFSQEKVFVNAFFSHIVRENRVQ
jgi:hypothetical protein